MLKEIPNHKGYFASHLGVIFKLVNDLHRPLKVRRANDGYKIVRVNGRQERVHRLVLWAFRGEAPPGFEGAHLNGVKTDNRIENLAWMSHEDNEQCKIYHGNATERKLTWMDAYQIKHCETGTYREVAAKYGVNFRTIADIKRGRTWKNT